MKHQMMLGFLSLLSVFSQQTARAESPRVEIVWSGTWYFAQGVQELSPDNLPERTSRFHLDSCGSIDLDSLLPTAGKLGDEAWICTEFEASCDGETVIGIGCDWYFQAFINDRECASTWEAGNGTAAYAPWNNPFRIKVKAGKNRLTVRVRRGTESWRFCCAETEQRFLIDLPATLALGTPAESGLPKRAGTSYRFLVLGDTHFDAPAGIYHTDYREPNAKLNQIQREEFARNAEMWETRCPSLLQAAAAHRNPETRGVIQVGDLVQGDCGNPKIHARMLADAREKIRSFFGTLPLLPVTGNHDIRGTGAKDANREFFSQTMSREWGTDVKGTTAFFLLNGDLYLLIDFNAPDVPTIIKAFETYPEARWNFVISHGPVLPSDTRDNRWMLFGGDNTLMRRWMRDLFLKHNVIVLTGHVHEMSLIECRTETGRITQIMINSVWLKNYSAALRTLATAPEEYGKNLESCTGVEAQLQLLNEYRPAVTRYWRAEGAGYCVLDVSPSHVDVRFYGGDSGEISQSFQIR